MIDSVTKKTDRLVKLILKRRKEMSRFPFQFDYDLGTLGSTPVQRTTFLRDNVFENDIFEFDLTGTRDINLSLNNISSGDDADLFLYRDSNNNGILDFSDELVASSRNGGNRDDSINLEAQAGGTYFARVNYFSGGSDGRINYDLDLSANSSGPSDVFGVEQNLGNLNADVTRFGWVGSTDTVDTYEFQLGWFEGVNISLSGLSSDADIRLVQDLNNDSVIQSNEIIGSSTMGGSFNELISGIQDPGTYQLQVYQFSGDTTYTLNFDHYTTFF